MNKEILKKRTTDFAHRCARLCSALPENWLGLHIRSQLIRCSTSAAANYRAACISQSKASFIAKLGIALEEADEACFWLEFITEENLLSENKCRLLLEEAKELTAIFAASQKTARNRKLKIDN
ncbi:MAG TPA: four helix bundle protein [Anaerohalosphaeraceae bacterium]|nr:four helix bundle protein [Anaerohalosphaeraceae bacterium]HOL88214.1 four helix bundle protein [Anaerohalosphaeraceae bacterium]HPP56073.1 four helix bundle protein [Anaerohalosphaeraceae bacterium]